MHEHCCRLSIDGIQYAVHDYTYVIEDALMNGTDKERLSAIYAVADGTIRTDPIKQLLLNTMNDESIQLEARLEAFSALSYFSQNEQEYALVYEFYQTVVSPYFSEVN